MPTKKAKCIKKQIKSKSKSKSKSKTNSNKGKTQKGGRSEISKPNIKYKKGSSESIQLNCTKCQHDSFVVKTMTLGTKLKALIKWTILDNRFKVFTCKNCGFVQMFSNEITCDGKSCD